MSSFWKCGGLYSKFHTIHPDISCMTYLMNEMIRVNSTIMYTKMQTEINVRIFVSSCHQTGHVACTHIFNEINSCMEVWNWLLIVVILVLHCRRLQKYDHLYAIYQYAFPHLYSSEVCSRNRLMLTDKDEAEYRSFESLIKTCSDFKQSTVFLCSFHGVWIAFKKDLLTLLEDCECGKVYGTLVFLCIVLYISNRISKFICINPYSFLYSVHVCIYRGVVVRVIHASSVCIWKQVPIRYVQ